MNRFVFIFSVVIGVLTVSCGFKKKEEPINNIQGNWVFDTSGLPNIGTGRVISKVRDNCGFEFQNDSCKMACAFYRKNESNVCDGMTTGSVTNFDIRNDSLRIWDLERNGWHTYLIKNLTKDSLVLFDLNMQYDVAYVRPKTAENIYFDGVIISKLYLGEGYKCVDESFYFDKQGYFYYKNSEDQLTSYWVNQDLGKDIFLGFNHLDLNLLKSEYIGGGTGASVHYAISFVKNGEIIKRVMDHQNTAPDELLQGYITMIGKLRQSKGENINVNNNVSRLVSEECRFFYQKMGIK